MQPPTQPQQWPPQQPYGQQPTPPQWGPPPPHHRKKSSAGKTMVIVGAVVLAVGVVAIVGLVLVGAAQQRAAEEAVRPMATTAGKTVRWNAEQQRTYLDMLSVLDPGLVANEDRAIRRAERICDRILNPPEGSTMSLERYVVEELSGGNATIDEATAGTVIGAIKVWCR
ncbi:DUF732 domain-containing protein [Microbispora rosea]